MFDKIWKYVVTQNESAAIGMIMIDQLHNICLPIIKETLRIDFLQCLTVCEPDNPIKQCVCIHVERLGTGTGIGLDRPRYRGIFAV